MVKIPNTKLKKKFPQNMNEQKVLLLSRIFQKKIETIFFHLSTWEGHDKVDVSFLAQFYELLSVIVDCKNLLNIFKLFVRRQRSLFLEKTGFDLSVGHFQDLCRSFENIYTTALWWNDYRIKRKFVIVKWAEMKLMFSSL